MHARLLFLRRSFVTLLMASLLAVAAAYATVNWSKSYAPLRWADMRIGSMLAGNARKPFVTRTLVPSLFKTVARYGEGPVEPIRRALLRFDQTKPIVEGFDTSQHIGSQARAALYVTMVWLSLLLLGLGIVAFLRSLGARSWSPWAIAIVALMLWPLLKCDERNMNFMYDPFTPTLFLWTFYAFFRRHFFAAGVGFIACMLNRETAIFLPVVAAYALLPGHGVREKLLLFWSSLRWGAPKPWLRVLPAVAVAMALSVATKLFVVDYVFAFALGESFELHLMNTTLSLPYALAYLPKMMVVWALVYVLGLRQWSRLNGLFQGAVLMFIAQLAAGAVVGVIDEFRQYSELYGIGAVLAGLALLRPGQVTPPLAERPTPRRRHVVNAFALTALALVLTSCYAHWRDVLAVRSHPERVDLAENQGLSRAGRDGEAWNASGNYLFLTRLPIVFVVNPPREVVLVDIGLDGNDDYRVTLRTDAAAKEYPIELANRNGIQNHKLDSPAGRLQEVEVLPLKGDRSYAVGHLVLQPK